MIQHNILISYRSFKRYRSSFLINLFGLSSGLACVLLIWLWVSDEMSVDKFHVHDAQLYEVMENVTQETGMLTRYTSPGPMSKALVAEFPEIEKAVTTNALWEQRFVLSVDDNDITSVGMYADPDFFTMFSYGMLHGASEQVLKDKRSIVLSENLAMSLFGTTENLIGKSVEWEHESNFLISGIMKQPPANSSLKFDFVMSFELFRDENEWVTNWYNTAPTTYVLLKEGTDVAALNEKIHDIVRVKTENQANHRSPFVTKFSDLYLYNRYENGVQSGGRIDYVRLFSVIAVFILLIACINFMNLSTAQASRRLKEVGVKKAMGASRGALIFQYLSESIFIVLLSTVVALTMVAFFLPKFNQITGKELELIFDSQLLFTILGIMLFTGIIAGSYPAFYLSAFNPVAVLKGKLNKQTGEQWARRGLVVFQFSLSIILIVAVWVVYQQIDYMQRKNLGYDQENIIMVKKTGNLQENTKSQTFINELRKLPGVLNASAISHNLRGRDGGTYGVVWPGKDPENRTEFERVPVDYGAIELLNIKMAQGRAFDRSFGADSSKIIFNQAGIDFMGIKD
ncbi:MAG: ABC transporter permease, partial [Bacteroidota bacterium]